MYADLDKKRAVEALIADNGLLHLDMVHAVGQGGSLLHLSRDGVVVRHPCGTVFAASFSPFVDGVVSAIPGDAGLIDVHDGRLFHALREKGFSFEEPCYLFSYHGGYRDEGPYRFRVLTVDDFPVYAGHYRSGGGDGELMEDLSSGNVFGIYDGGVMMGFAGFHREGAMGMLEVFPAFRRKGVGTCLLSHLINMRKEKDLIPFCNVYISNEASIKLQRSIGMIKAEGLSYWLWK